MSYLIARNGKIETVYNVKEIKENFTHWLFVKENGEVIALSKYSTDLLGEA